MCGSKWKDGKGARRGDDLHQVKLRDGSREKWKAAATQALSTEGRGKEAGQRMEGLSLAKLDNQEPRKGFLRKGAAEAHLCSGKTVRTGV